MRTVVLSTRTGCCKVCSELYDNFEILGIFGCFQDANLYLRNKTAFAEDVRLESENDSIIFTDAEGTYRELRLTAVDRNDAHETQKANLCALMVSLDSEVIDSDMYACGCVSDTDTWVLAQLVQLEPDTIGLGFDEFIIQFEDDGTWHVIDREGI